MTAETDNLPQGGTDNALSSTSIDNPANWNFADPDDDQDNQKAQTKPETEGGTVENAEGIQETAKSEEPEPEGDEEPQERDNSKPPHDDVTVPLPDGNKVTLAELKQGYLRQSDYTRKVQDVANRRNELNAMAINAQNTMMAVTAFLEQNLPPKPDPMLAASDPAKFIAMKAHHEQAMEQLQQAHYMAQQPQEVVSEVEAQQYHEFLAHERQKMQTILPQLSNEKGRQQFIERAFEVGKMTGFTPEEIMGTAEARYLAVLDLAIEGLAARKAKQSAKTKVANVPPAVQPKQRQADVRVTKNRDAMRKLANSGSIKDAMMVDFE